MIHNKIKIRKDSASPTPLPGVRARLARDSQDGVSQQHEASPLFVPQIDRLYEANLRGEVQGHSANHLTVVVV